MKKRTVITIIAVVGLVAVAFASGSVFAQGILSSSSGKDAGNAPTTSGPEAAPGSNMTANTGAVYSSVDGNAPASLNVNLDESEFHVANLNGPAPSSASGASSPGGSSMKVEPSVINRSEIVPGAMAYNTSIRFVGNTLKPRANTANYAVTGGGGCVYLTSGDIYEVWDLPLALPTGARVEWLRMYYYDNDAVNTMSGWFTKYDLYGGIVQEWNVQSTTGGYNYSDVQVTPAQTIDYNNYSYVVNWRPYATGTNMQLCGFRIFYFYYIGLNLLPAIQK